MGGISVSDGEIDGKRLHRAVYTLSAEGQEVVRIACQVHQVRVNLDLWQLIERRELFIEALEIELAFPLFNDAPVLQLDGRLLDCLLDESCVLNRLPVFIAMLLFNS